ncbi:MAG: hypothetical protein WBA35_09550, partial [Litorimonas sp.]
RTHMLGLKLQDWTRKDDVIRLDYVGAKVLLNFGTSPVDMLSDPDMVSRPVEGNELPARTGAVWLR